MQKLDMTEAEEETALLENAALWNLRNTNHQSSIESWRKRLAEAKAEGHKSERCECGIPFLAFHHFTTCRRDGCPMRSSDKTMLEQWMEEQE